jgi:hypothetical protein
MLGRSFDAAFKRASEGSRDSRRDVRWCEFKGELVAERLVVGDGVEVCGCERRLRRCMASPEAFSRMYCRSASVRPGMASLMSMQRTLVGEPWSGKG